MRNVTTVLQCSLNYNMKHRLWRCLKCEFQNGSVSTSFAFIRRGYYLHKLFELLIIELNLFENHPITDVALKLCWPTDQPTDRTHTVFSCSCSGTVSVPVTCCHHHHHYHQHHEHHHHSILRPCFCVYCRLISTFYTNSTKLSPVTCHCLFKIIIQRP